MRKSVGGNDVELEILRCSTHPKALTSSTIVNTPIESGRSPLHESIIALDVNEVELLVKSGADVNVPDDQGTRPYLLAHCNVVRNDPDKMSRYENIVDILTSAGAEVNIGDPKSGFTMLHHAVFLESQKATERLLEHGADPSRESLDPWAVTPVHVAARTGNDGLLSILLQLLVAGLPENEWPSVVDIPNKDKPSALQVAVRYNNLECIRTLIDMGGNLGRRDPYSKNESIVIDSFCTLTHGLEIADFFRHLLDTKICRADRPSNDSLSKYEEPDAILDYKVLAPAGEPQMTVIAAIIRSMESTILQKILEHPLPRAYLREKWLRVRKVFYGLLMFHVLFVFYISAYDSSDDIYSMEQNLMLFIFAFVPFCHNFLLLFAQPRWYFRRFEDWISFISVTIVISVAITIEINKNDMAELASWIVPIHVVAIILAWYRLTVIFSVLLGWGYYTALISFGMKVVGKGMLLIACMLAGSGIALYNMPKPNINGTMVLTYGFDFDTTYDPEDVVANFSISIIDAILLLVFVFLNGIVYWRYVNYVTAYQERTMITEFDYQYELLINHAEFIAGCERIMATWICRRCCLPKCLTNVLDTTINTSRVVHRFVASPSRISSSLRKDIILASDRKTEDSATAIRLLDEKCKNPSIADSSQPAAGLFPPTSCTPWFEEDS